MMDIYAVAVNSGPTGTHVIPRIHLEEFFTPDYEIKTLLAISENFFKEHKSDRFDNENSRVRLSELNLSFDFFFKRKQSNDYLHVFIDVNGLPRRDLRLKLPVEDINFHSAKKFLASATVLGYPQASLHTPLWFQSASLVLTSHSTTRSHSTGILNNNNPPSISLRSPHIWKLRNNPR